MNRKIIIISAVSGAIAVVLGAFGAHALKSLLSPNALDNWHTAVNYQFIHTLALLFLSVMPANRRINTAAWCFGSGILLFSGSLYLLSLRELIALPISFLGPITPLGGLLFILGWLMLLLSVLKNK